MNGAEALLESLKQEGVDTLFGISGGAILPIYDALGKQEDIWSILTRHEQGAGHMAEGYARATGRVGCCIGKGKEDGRFRVGSEPRIFNGGGVVVE